MGIFSIIEKVFMSLLGILLIILMYQIFSSTTQQSCFPSEAFKKDPVLGFNIGIFDGIYDNLCNTFLNMNSGIWNLYKTWTGRTFASGMLKTMGNTMLNAARPFCKTHTNANYDSEEGDDAITEPEALKEIFLYEAERCWNIFEGKLQGESDTDRDPIPTLGFFKCAEMIYSFESDESLPIKEIGDRIYGQDDLGGKNTCGETINIPKNIFWCAPKSLMFDYWYGTKMNNDLYYYSYYDGQKVTSLNAPDDDNNPHESTHCFIQGAAVVSFGQIDGYNDNSEGYSVIDGAGIISIYYFDNYPGDILGKEHTYDALPGCEYVQVFDGFNKIAESSTYEPSEYETQYYSLMDDWFASSEIKYAASLALKDNDKNTLVICYEKYDAPTYECTGTYDCSTFSNYYGSAGVLLNAEGIRKCKYSYGCEYSYINGCVSSGLGNTCSTFKTKNLCLSNEEIGCDWGLSGECKLKSSAPSFNCGNCATNIGRNSLCDKSSLCYENWDVSGHPCQAKSADLCSSITSKYLCEANNCAGCEWV